MPRIAFIVDKISPFYVGGYESRYWNLASRLSSLADIRVYTSLAPDRVQVGGVQFHRLCQPVESRIAPSGRSLRHAVKFSLSLVREPFGEWQPDVVVVEAIPLLHMLPLSFWHKGDSMTNVLNVNEAWWQYSYLNGIMEVPSKFAFRKALKIGIEWADQVITISTATSISLTQHYHASRVSVIPMGIDLSMISQYSGVQVSKDFDFATVGRLVPIKRHCDFLCALAQLRLRFGWKGRAVVIGDGPSMGDLRKLAYQLHLEDHVLFAGRVGEAEKFDLLRRSAVVIHPSEREGFAVAVLEGMACGLPAVVARPEYDEVFGTRDFVIEGETGFYFPVRDFHALANVMAFVFARPELVREMGTKAYMVARRYDWNVLARQFLGTVLGSTWA